MRGQAGQVGQATPIDVLDDDVLLEIFDSYVTDFGRLSEEAMMDAWQSLVHVCGRWRRLVFGSPRRLNLRLFYAAEAPARESLDVWPALPLVVDSIISSRSVDNIVIALGYSDRVCRINLLGVTPGWKWDRVSEAMQVPFPNLTGLLLKSEENETLPVIPDTFLGGSAPLLEYFALGRIPFPGIPNLLMSATHLVNLDLLWIPPSGYFSPEAMATCLSALTRLHTLHLSLHFLYSRSRRRPPPTTRSILPDLKTFSFKGAREYLDDLIAHIDTPQLDNLSMIFYLDHVNFNTPNLVQFISRTPRLQEPNQAYVTLDLDVAVKLFWSSDDHARLSVRFSYDDLDVYPEPSSMAEVCTKCLPPLSTVEDLRFGVFTEDQYSDWKVDVENDQWLELLRPFAAVKSLYLYEESAPVIAAALQELIGSRISEVLPSLQNIFVESLRQSGRLRENIDRFVTARQLSGHSIAISDWPKSYFSLPRPILSY